MKFENKVVVVTGASSGIGEGVAKMFLEEGAKVVGCGIEPEMKIQDSNAVYVQETTSNESFMRELSINMGGVFNMCKAAVPELKKHEGSTIVTVGSDLGVRPIPERIGYCPSKAGVIMLTKCIALEYAPAIRVNCILPGLVRTPMIEQRFQEADDPKALEEFRTGHADPAGRTGSLPCGAYARQPGARRVARCPCDLLHDVGA